MEVNSVYQNGKLTDEQVQQFLAIIDAFPKPNPWFPSGTDWGGLQYHPRWNNNPFSVRFRDQAPGACPDCGEANGCQECYPTPHVTVSLTSWNDVSESHSCGNGESEVNDAIA
jgi:hypothetical protein